MELRRRTWDHVTERHPELADLLDEVIEAIQHPDYRELDPIFGRVRFVRHMGRRNVLRVVTEFAGDEDVVITAFLDTRPPR